MLLGSWILELVVYLESVGAGLIRACALQVLGLSACGIYGYGLM